jgi:poly(3-hydroxybutyrate) depolymerase
MAFGAHMSTRHPTSDAPRRECLPASSVIQLEACDTGDRVVLLGAELRDSRRDGGEALSVKQMIDRMKLEHQIDPARIFVNGLSAGGGMTSVMLATYPDVFAAGAIIAGLPYRCGTATRTADVDCGVT